MRIIGMIEDSCHRLAKLLPVTHRMQVIHIEDAAALDLILVRQLRHDLTTSPAPTPRRGSEGSRGRS
jgi:hypothetical protein